MGKTTTTALGVALAGVPVSSAALDIYYDELETEWGASPLMTWVDTIQSVAGTNTYTAQGGTQRIWVVFFGTLQLQLVDLRELEAQNPSWRSASNGTPAAATLQGESEDTLVLYPPPVSGSSGVSTFPTGLAASFQANQLSLLVSRLDMEIPDWMDLTLALDALGRELRRDSAQRDEEAAGFADGLRDVAQLLLLAS